MKKLLLIIFFSFLIINCLSVTIYLKDNNLLTGEIKKIDKQKIYLSTTYSEKLFIINKTDIKSISGIRSYTESEIDLTVEVLTQEPYGRINYNSYSEVTNIELDNNENSESIDYTADVIVKSKPEKIKTSSTFDDKREGFIFGFGLGGHHTSFKQEIKYEGEVLKSGTITKKGLATDVRIGFSPKNNLEIYFVSKVAWFNISNMYEQTVLISDGVGALGITYFFPNQLNPEKGNRIPYLSIGFGFSGWSTPFEEGSSSSIGTGLFTAAGFELNGNSRLELSYFINNPSDEENGVKLITRSQSFMILFNKVWY